MRALFNRKIANRIRVRGQKSWCSRKVANQGRHVRAERKHGRAAFNVTGGLSGTELIPVTRIRRPT